MANVDNPNGFKWAYSLSGRPAPAMDKIVLAGTVAKGDTLVFSAGTATIGLSNSSTIHGVAAEAGVSGDTISFYPAIPDNIFEAQCSGTYATASHLHAELDIEGTTGIQEVDEDASTYNVFHVIGIVNDGVNAVGANCHVYGYFGNSSYYKAIAPA